MVMMEKIKKIINLDFVFTHQIVLMEQELSSSALSNGLIWFFEKNKFLAEDWETQNPI